MDHPRNAAQRIRPILQAMERSIDSARRRRTNEPDPIAGATSSAKPASASTIPSASASSNFRGHAGAATHGVIGSIATQQRQSILDQTQIGGGRSATPAQPNNPAGVIKPGETSHPRVAAQTPTPGGLQPNPATPPRLKAKPKPASPFLNELDPPAYRSQAS